LLFPELQDLEFVAGKGFRTEVLQFTTLRLGEGFAGQAALERRIIQIPDLNNLNTGFLRSPKFSIEEFVAYIGVPLSAKGNIIGVLEIYNRKPLGHDTEWMAFLETLAGQAAIAIDNINLLNDLQKSNQEVIQAYDATIEGWVQALDFRDMETEGHSRRVVDMTLKLARALDIRNEEMPHIRRGALLHDIGKMDVPDNILQKPEKLTDKERVIMQQHPVNAHKWLSKISFLERALVIPYCHHEKWDGSGYPQGLKGEQIPLPARIFAIVDVWDALGSDRPYRKAWSRKKTMKHIQDQSGKHFDPTVVEKFLEMLKNDPTK
jgi:putative nucleotidyltransferase with HDIG domain